MRRPQGDVKRARSAVRKRHPGYDFRVSDLGSDVIIVACAKGVTVPSLCGSYENRVFIEHEELGLATAYLHLKKWHTNIFDPNDIAGNAFQIYHARAISVEQGQPIGLAGGAGAKSGQKDPGAFDPHLHMELYKVTVKNGRKYYVLLDPYGAYTETGKQAYGSFWKSSTTPAALYNAQEYKP